MRRRKAKDKAMTGRMVIVKVWVFASSSGSRQYQTLQYEDRTTSCDCPGWTKRSVRSCKHTRYVECGLADANAIACTDYTQRGKLPASAPVSALVQTTRGRSFDLT